MRFRQQSFIHDFVRDSLRTALVKARPAAGFLAALDAAANASPTLMPPAISPLPGSPEPAQSAPEEQAESELIQSGDREAQDFQLKPPTVPPVPGQLPFDGSALSAFDPRAISTVFAHRTQGRSDADPLPEYIRRSQSG